MSATELNARKKPQCTAVVLSGGNTPGEEKGVRTIAESVYVFELSPGKAGLWEFTVATHL